jgi:hypothetical protein
VFQNKIAFSRYLHSWLYLWLDHIVLYCVVGLVGPGILNDSRAFFFTVKQSDTSDAEVEGIVVLNLESSFSGPHNCSFGTTCL